MPSRAHNTTVEARWLHDPYLLNVPTGDRSQIGYITRAFSGVHTWGKNQGAYIAPTLLGCLERGGIKIIATFKGQPRVGEIKLATFVIAFMDAQRC